MINEITIESPWGDAEFGSGRLSSVIKFGLKQLKYLQKKKNTEYIRLDIKGYEEILSSSDPDKNADSFLRTKQEKNQRFSNNISVIQYLKKKGEWVE